MAIHNPTLQPIDELCDFLLSQPTLEQISTLKASETAQMRLRYLLDGNRNHTLNDAERAELEACLWLDHFVIRLKIRAREKMLEQA